MGLVENHYVCNFVYALPFFKLLSEKVNELLYFLFVCEETNSFYACVYWLTPTTFIEGDFLVFA